MSLIHRDGFLHMRSLKSTVCKMNGFSRLRERKRECEREERGNSSIPERKGEEIGIHHDVIISHDKYNRPLDRLMYTSWKVSLFSVVYIP